MLFVLHGVHSSSSVIVQSTIMYQFLIKCFIGMLAVWQLMVIGHYIRHWLRRPSEGDVLSGLDAMLHHPPSQKLAKRPASIYFRNTKSASEQSIRAFHQRCRPYWTLEIWNNSAHEDKLLHAFPWLRSFYLAQDSVAREDILLTLQLYLQGGWYMEEVYDCDTCYAGHPPMHEKYVDSAMFYTESWRLDLIRALHEAVSYGEVADFLHRFAYNQTGEYASFVTIRAH